MRKKLIIILVVVLSFFTAAAALPEKQKRNVLFLSAYNIDFDTYSSQLSGIKSILKENEFSLYYDFMDTKKVASEEYFLAFYKMLEIKIESYPKLDAVLLGDDAALKFAKQYQEELFSKTPCIFLGINDAKMAHELSANYYFTGVIEDNPLEETIEMALGFYPEALNIVGIVDSTLTGQADEASFLLALNSFKDKTYEVINTSLQTYENLCEKLKTYDESSILLYLTAFEDSLGARKSISEACSLIYNSAKIPFFRTSVSGIGNGALASASVSHFEQGKNAAMMLYDVVINAKNIADIKVIDNSTYKYEIDYKILQKFNLSLDNAPQGYILYNKSDDLFQQGLTIFILIISLAFVASIAIFLLLKNRRVNRANKVLSLNVKEMNIAVTTDILTQLPNRRSLYDYLDKLIEEKTSFFLGMIDLDYFKDINDEYGHSAGDVILQKFAARSKNIANADLIVYRFAGDEFIMVIKNDKITEVVDKVKKTLIGYYEVEGKEIYLSFSLGISQFPQDGLDKKQLIDAADKEMYFEKKAKKIINKSK